MQIILVITPPHMAILENSGPKEYVRGCRREEIRKIPYPPSFRRSPARIIDPATGASTWAFGSHK